MGPRAAQKASAGRSLPTPGLNHFILKPFEFVV